MLCRGGLDFKRRGNALLLYSIVLEARRAKDAVHKGVGWYRERYHVAQLSLISSQLRSRGAPQRWNSRAENSSTN